MKKEIGEILEKLSAPFVKEVGGKRYPDHKWLPKDGKSMTGKIICMPYISGGQVRDRLNEVLGIEGWMYKSQLEPDGTRTGTLSIKIGENWIDRDGVGTKSVSEAEKGADTDALKRAARAFGVGAYLEKLSPYFVDAKAGGNGKPAPVDKQGRKLFGDKLHNYINGFSSEQGYLAQLLMFNPEAWKIQEFKTLWEKLK